MRADSEPEQTGHRRFSSCLNTCPTGGDARSSANNVTRTLVLCVCVCFKDERSYVSPAGSEDLIKTTNESVVTGEASSSGFCFKGTEPVPRLCHLIQSV